MVACNPQKQQHIGPSGLHAGITVTSAVTDAECGLRKPQKSRVHHSEFSTSFMGLFLKIKKIVMLLPSCSASVTRQSAASTIPGGLEY